MYLVMLFSYFFYKGMYDLSILLDFFDDLRSILFREKFGLRMFNCGDEFFKVVKFLEFSL